MSRRTKINKYQQPRRIKKQIEQHTAANQASIVIGVDEDLHVVKLEQLGAVERQNALKDHHLSTSNAVEVGGRADASMRHDPRHQESNLPAMCLEIVIRVRDAAVLAQLVKSLHHEIEIEGI